MRLFFAFALAFAIFALPKPSKAQIYETLDAPTLATIFQDLGYRAQIEDPDGPNSRVQSSANGVGFTVFFHSCDEGALRCSSIRYYFGFNPSEFFTLEMANSWNIAKRYGRAVMTSNRRMVLVYDINIDNGVTAANFRESFDIWQELQSTFIDYIRQEVSDIRDAQP